MIRVQAVVFDLGSTLLIPEKRHPEKAWRYLLELAGTTGSAVREEEFLQYAEEVSEKAWSDRDASCFDFRHTALVRILADRFSLDFQSSVESVAAEMYRRLGVARKADNLDVTLDALDSAGIRKAVLSNSFASAEVLQTQLASHGLADRFEFVMSSADYAYKKPEPLIFRIAAARLGLPTNAICYVGDIPRLDITGALAAGMFAVWYNRDGQNAEDCAPTAVIHDWSQFPALIDLTATPISRRRERKAKSGGRS